MGFLSRLYTVKCFYFFSDEEVNEELKIIEVAARNNGYNKEIVQKIPKKRIKIFNIIQSGQKTKKEKHHTYTIL